MKWLNKYQRKLCYRFPEMIQPIKDGVKHAVKECRRQFSSFRWNCSTLDWKQVLTEGGILKKRKSQLIILYATFFRRELDRYDFINKRCWDIFTSVSTIKEISFKDSLTVRIVGGGDQC